MLACGALALVAACSPSPAASPTAPLSASPQASLAPAVPSPSAAAAGSPASADELHQIVAAAQQEGHLSLVWSELPFGQASTVQQLISGYKQAYGLNIDVTYAPGTDMNTFANSSVLEYQGNQPSSSDVIIGAATIMDYLIQAGDVQDGHWMDWAPNVTDPGMVAPGGIGVHFGAYFPGIEYNTQLFTPDTAPKTMQDLLKPEFKGKVATTPYAAHFDELSSPEVWGEQRTLDYAQQLTSQLAGLIRCGSESRIISGEFPAFGLACGSQDTDPLIAQGAPLAYVIPSDAAIIDYWYMAVPKNSAHPNAAKLWVNYIVSPAAQKILWDTADVDDPLVAGSHSAQQVATLRSQGASVTEVDVAWYERNATQMKTTLAQIVKILSKQ